MTKVNSYNPVGCMPYVLNAQIIATKERRMLVKHAC